MLQRSLKEIEKMAGGFGLTREYGKIIKGVSIDTRRITDNQLFVPIKGENFDGHAFIEAAVAAGATAALWNQDQPLPKVEIPIILVEDTVEALQRLAREYRLQLNTKVIGITGSNGKTSTKDILAGVLEAKYKTKKTFGNLNNHLGVPLTLLELDEDTEMAVVEMGIDQLGEMELLSSIAIPDAAIITNIGEAHLTTLGTKENIYNEKLKIVSSLKENGLLVYYGDDEILGKKVEGMRLKQRTASFGAAAYNSHRPILEAAKNTGICFSLEGVDESSLQLPMLGRHQMYNAAAAIAVAEYFNLSLSIIREGLLNIDATGMRNELIPGEGITILNDAYKSNPSSLRAALDTLYELKGYKQKVAVLGDMEGIGADEIEFHKAIGREIEPKEIDYIFTIGPLATNLAEAAKDSFSEKRVFICSSREELIKGIKQILVKDTLILVKASRGLQLEKVVDELLKGANSKL